MTTCPACRHENRVGAGFCDVFGTPLDAPAPERRKLATILFCDVTGSMSMGERLDPETVRELMFQYFHEVRDAIERHGGRVEKFIGDAVMAVFGVPDAHEDDALRACRAAQEMQQGVLGLAPELERRLGARLQVRIGVNTGEVVAGAGRETFATGDAVNVAARLEQAAAPGVVVIGELTRRLAGDAVEAEPLAPSKRRERRSRSRFSAFATSPRHRRRDRSRPLWSAVRGRSPNWKRPSSARLRRVAACS